jgi:hypothetical protein
MSRKWMLLKQVQICARHHQIMTPSSIAGLQANRRGTDD